MFTFTDNFRRHTINIIEVKQYLIIVKIPQKMQSIFSMGFWYLLLFTEFLIFQTKASVIFWENLEMWWHIVNSNWVVSSLSITCMAFLPHEGKNQNLIIRPEWAIHFGIACEIHYEMQLITNWCLCTLMNWIYWALTHFFPS